MSGPDFVKVMEKGVQVGWNSRGLKRFRLGVPLGTSDESHDTHLSAERFEFLVRYHRRMRALQDGIVTPFDEDNAHSEAERLALEEMRKLQKNGGHWLTRARAEAQRPGRKLKSPDLVERWSAMRLKRPALTVRSAARILANTLRESPTAIEARLRRRLGSSTKRARK